MDNKTPRQVLASGLGAMLRTEAPENDADGLDGELRDQLAACAVDVASVAQGSAAGFLVELVGHENILELASELSKHLGRPGAFQKKGRSTSSLLKETAASFLALATLAEREGEPTVALATTEAVALPVYKSGDYLDERPERPFGWIQWKGTAVCMDIHCLCGVLGHIDADFAYHVKCGKCGRTYDVNGHVRLHEMPGGVDPGSCAAIVFGEDDAEDVEVPGGG